MPINMSETSVGIVMGSKSDEDTMAAAEEALIQFGVAFETKVLSAHRSPELVRDYASGASERGIKVIIAGAGKAAHLAGVIASHTTLPVIGVPIKSSDLGGMDSLLSTVQMPPGIPVATVAIDGARNAAILAVEILSLSDASLAEKLKVFRLEMSGEYGT